MREDGSRRWLSYTLQWLKPGFRVLDASNPDDHMSRVWVDGDEVTDLCLAALVPSPSGQMGQGWAAIYEHDEQGSIQADDKGELIIRVKYGLVKWEPR